MSMTVGIRDWFAKRWPFAAMTRIVLEEDIPGGASYYYSFGSAILILFTLQAITGLMQLFYYVPSINEAYNSISYLRIHVPFGWLIHGLHYWGAQVIIVLLVLHLGQVFIWGAYKRPRELTWFAGVTLLLTMMAFSFTGAPLHWDQRGYWAAQVGTSIAGVVPVVGDMTKTILRGGEGMGQLTISRFFGAHVAVLPLTLAALIGFHIVAMRQSGAAGPWNRERRETSGPFWPDQVFKDAVIGVLIFFVLITLVVFLPPEYTGQADRLDTTYVPKPEWNFLFLYEALKYFSGKLEPIGAAGVPAVMVGFLALIPFIDRGEERNPFKRPVAMIGGLLLGGIVVVLSIMGYMSPGYGSVAKAKAPAATVQTTAKAPVNTTGHQNSSEKQQASQAAAPFIGDGQAGAQLFQQNCSACHGNEGKKGIPDPGSTRGFVPALNPIEKAVFSNDAQEFATHVKKFIHDGSTPRGPSPAFSMPSFGSRFSPSQMNDLAAYILSLNGIKTEKAGGSKAPASTTKEQPQEAQSVKPHEHADKATAASGQERTEHHRHKGDLPSPASNVDPSETGKAAFIIGSVKQGEKLFSRNCESCHGPEGKGGTPNPGSADGMIPTLNPMQHDLLIGSADELAQNLDHFIQHGSVPAGTPAISMPAFGDSNTLTQQQIANVIAYLMSLNGVDRAAVLNPGMSPRAFYLAAVVLLVLAVLALGGIWGRRMRRRQEEER